MAKPKADNKKERTNVISFRVSDDLYRQLEAVAKEEVDEAGLNLNANTAARRLMLLALKARSKKKGD